MEAVKKTKGHGSFCISKKAITVLLSRKATALHIGAYLTLARYTDETHRYSTGSLKAIYTATGASNIKGSTAERIVNELCAMQSGDKLPKGVQPALIYKPDEWQKITKISLPEIPHKLHTIQHVLNDFGGGEYVWFPNSLVDGIGKFKQPLKRLKQCGDVAARLMLLMYERDNMMEFGGVPPYDNVYHGYSTEHVTTSHGCSFWSAIQSTRSVFGSLSVPSLGIAKIPMDGVENDKVIRVFFDALTSLESMGFINEVVTVMDGSANDQDARPLYILQSKERHGYADTSLDLAGPVDYISSKMENNSCADSQGRFNGKYSVIVPAGIKPYTVGIYRLRFRISNTNNLGVRSAWVRMRSDYNDMADTLVMLAERAGIGENIPGLVTPKTTDSEMMPDGYE